MINQGRRIFFTYFFIILGALLLLWIAWKLCLAIVCFIIAGMLYAPVLEEMRKPKPRNEKEK